MSRIYHSFKEMIPVPSIRSLFGPDADMLRETNFQLIFLTSMLGAFGVAMLSPIIDSMISPLGASPASIGLLMSFYTAPAIVLIPIAGVLADRFGRKAVLVPSIVLFGTAGTAVAFTTTFEIVLGLRLLQGVAFGGISPLLVVAIRDLYEGSAESTAQGLRLSAAGISASVFPLVSGLLVIISWRIPFLLTAVALPVAAGLYLWFDEPTTHESDSGSGIAGMVSYSKDLGALLTRPRVSAILIGRALPITVWIGFATYISIIVVEISGGTPSQVGVLVSLWGLVVATSSSQAGRVTALFSNRFYPLLISNISLGAGFVIVVFAPDVWIVGAGTVLSSSGLGISLALFTSLLTGLASEDLRGGLVSLGVSLNRIVQTLTPIAVGGIIGIGAPIVGLVQAIQLAGLGVAGVGAGGSILCLVVASLFPPTAAEQSVSDVT